jgi:hypothetical protein
MQATCHSYRILDTWETDIGSLFEPEEIG